LRSGRSSPSFVDTAYLKAFLRIADFGSISRAAESLGITQPSLSQQVLRLEDEVGFRLFERTTRGVTLTEGGRVFQERAQQILYATEQAIADARELRAEARGQVLFAMPPSIARLLGAPLVEALAQQAPFVRVRVIEAFSGAIRGWLETDKINLGILYEVSPFRHLATRRLASEELVLVGPRGRFGDANTDAELPLSALDGKALIAPGAPHGLRQVIEREAARAGIKLQVDQEIDALDTILGLVEHGHGLAVLPRCAVTAAVESGRLSSARVAEGGMQRMVILARNPAHVLSHASVKVESLTFEVLAQLSAQGRWSGRVQAG
jgi:LysR family nitrogen assimilation transcriptional regulator